MSYIINERIPSVSFVSFQEDTEKMDRYLGAMQEARLLTQRASEGVSPFMGFEVSTFRSVISHIDDESEREGFKRYRETIDNLHTYNSHTHEELYKMSTLEAFTLLNNLTTVSRVMESAWDNIWVQRVLAPNRREGDGLLTLSEFLSLSTQARDDYKKNYLIIDTFEKHFSVNEYEDMLTVRNQLGVIVRERCLENPTELRMLMRELFLNTQEWKYIQDFAIDMILGISEEEKKGYQRNETYGKEQVAYQGTPYFLAAAILEQLDLKDIDIFYDLGSGMGKVLLLGALLYPQVEFKGIEIVEERVEATRKIAAQLGIFNLSIQSGDVRNAKFTDGTVFFLFNPFEKSTLEEIGEKLCEVSKNRQIKIVSLVDPNNYFAVQPWLTKNTPALFTQETSGKLAKGIQFYSSV